MWLCCVLTVVSEDVGVSVVSEHCVDCELRVGCLEERQCGLNELSSAATAALRTTVNDRELAQLPDATYRHPDVQCYWSCYSTKIDSKVRSTLRRPQESDGDERERRRGCAATVWDALMTRHAEWFLAWAEKEVDGLRAAGWRVGDAVILTPGEASEATVGVYERGRISTRPVQYEG